LIRRCIFLAAALGLYLAGNSLPTVAVQMPSKTPKKGQWQTPQDEDSAALAHRLTIALVNSHRFNVVERQEHGRVLTESKFRNDGLARNPVALGKQMGADFIVVTESDIARTRIAPTQTFWGPRGGSVTTTMTVSIRFVSTETGAIVDALEVKGDAVEPYSDGRKASPFSDAKSRALDAVTEKLKAAMEGPLESAKMVIHGGIADGAMDDTDLEPEPNNK